MASSVIHSSSLGVCDRNDHQAGREEQEEGSPEEEAGEEPLGKVLDIGGGGRVEYVSTSYQGSYFQR